MPALAVDHPAELILPIAEALALALGLDPSRALRWTAVWTVHQAAQAWRADEQHLERLVCSASHDPQLATCGWVQSGHPLCLIGDSGTGKSPLLIGLGTVAAEAGLRVKYTLATKLVEAADEKVLAETIARYGRVDLFYIDQLGFMELDRRGADTLFQVLTEREEKNSLAIASNESFSGWIKTFTDPRSCAAIITFGGHIIETGTHSCRLATTHAQQVG